MKLKNYDKMQNNSGDRLKSNKGKMFIPTKAYYYFMVLPGIFLLLLFNYVPMGGLVMAFQDFKVSKGIFGSEFVGLKYFKNFFNSIGFTRIIRNTILLSVSKMTICNVLAICFAIMINEVRIKWLKKTVQTVSYLPHFMSWVILAGMMTNLFSMAGPINELLTKFGLDKINFFSDDSAFRPLLIWSDVWKGFGYSSIIYLAAITGVDPGLHEAAAIDGAGWWQRVWHVTLPAMLPIIILNICLNVSGILNAGFEQVYNLYSPVTYESGDIIDTYVYRAGLLDKQYSLSTAIGLFKSVIGMTLMLLMNECSKKFAKRSVF